METMIDKEVAAHLAEITITVAPVQASFTPEEVNQLLGRQRQAIADRIRKVSGTPSS